MLTKDSGTRPAAGLAAQLLQALAREALAACDPAADVRLPAPRLRLKTIRGEHPVPLKDSFAAGKAALRFAARATAADDVIFLASGGGSALMAAPLPPLLREIDKTNLHKVLLTCGAPIGAINTVRKHLSAVKGGRLAILARRAA